MPRPLSYIRSVCVCIICGGSVGTASSGAVGVRVVGVRVAGVRRRDVRSEVAVYDCVLVQFSCHSGEDHASLAEQVDLVGHTEGEGDVLLDQQKSNTFGAESVE